MSVKQNAMTLKIGLKDNWQINTLRWVVVAVTVVVFQLYIPKARVDIIGDKASVLSFNSILRGMFLISPWVGVLCSVGGQINTLPRILINPAHLLTPTIYALLGVAFNRLSKKWGRSIGKDFILLTAFGLIQSSIAILNGALTNSIGLGQALIVSVNLAGITLPYLLVGAMINTLVFYLSYPLTRFVDKTTKSDPFRPNLLIRK